MNQPTDRSPSSTFRRTMLTMLVALQVQSAWGGYFLGLVDLPGGNTDSTATAISADGSTVVGYTDTSTGAEAFRWNLATGLHGLADLAGGIAWSEAHGVSADGSVVVGLSHSAQGMEAFRWSSDTGMSGLGDFLDDQQVSSLASAVSADGKTIIGTGNYSAGGGPRPVTGKAFVWNSQAGLQPLPGLPNGPDCSRANDLTPDASMIVGIGNCDASFQVEDIGLAVTFHRDAPATPLDAKPEIDQRSFAYAVANNGIVVGAHTVETGRFGRTIARRWLSDGTSQDLTSDKLAFSMARDVNANGQVVVGEWLAGDTQPTAFYWDEVRGALDLRTLLLDFGFHEAAAWTLDASAAISADGRTIAGTGTNPLGQREAWVAQLSLKTPGDFDFNRIVDASDIDHLSEVLRAGRQDLPFDTNHDLRVTADDRLVWVVEIARTYFGDANLDATFSSQDLIQVFQAGEYEDQKPRNSTWSEGDWDGNGDFESADLIVAFQQGGYEQGPRTVAVPEIAPPLILPLLAMILLLRERPIFG